MVAVVLAVYVSVLVAEIAGDKTLYTVGTLATRHRAAPVLVGSAVAASAKMLVAVLFGRVVAQLPSWFVTVVSIATFLGMAVTLWRASPEVVTPSRGSSRHGFVASASIAAAAVFFSEWADVGQLTVAVLSAKYGAPVLVWIGASLAMITKIVFSATLGAGLRRWVPHRVLRAAGVALCVAMAVVTALRIEV